MTVAGHTEDNNKFIECISLLIRRFDALYKREANTQRHKMHLKHTHTHGHSPLPVSKQTEKDTSKDINKTEKKPHTNKCGFSVVYNQDTILIITLIFTA